MIVTRKSLHTGKVRSIDLDITLEEMDNYDGGLSIQKAFPRLDEDEREFFMTGITKEEWDDIFPEEND